MKIKNHKHKWEKTPFIGNVIGENKELRLYHCSVCKCVKWDKDKNVVVKCKDNIIGG